MPIFSAVFGSLFFRDRLGVRAWAGVGAAFAGVLLLLWHEVGALGSKPLGVMLMLIAAAGWAWGTQLLRRTEAPVPLMTLSLWMVAITTVVLTVLAFVFERKQWHMPDQTALAAIAFNGILVLGFAQAVWFYLARSLPPVASTLSVMMIPVLGVFVGAWWLGEVLHWQDWTAVCLMVVAIASVLWPAKNSR
jgi:drug/metabolite transporter (DMT)-like permease